MPNTWTDEEKADYAVWEAEFGEPIEDSEHDAWLDLMDAEIDWAKVLPSA